MNLLSTISKPTINQLESNLVTTDNCTITTNSDSSMMRPVFTTKALQLGRRNPADLSTRPRQYNRKPLADQPIPISVRFRLCKPVKAAKKMSTCGLTVLIRLRDKTSAKAQVAFRDFAHLLQVKPNRWDSNLQRSHYPADPINEQLCSLKQQAESIYLGQKELAAPTAKSILTELSTGQRPRAVNGQWQLKADRYTPKEAAALFSTLSKDSLITDAYQAYIAHLHAQKHAQNGLSDISLGRWDYGLNLLYAYQSDVGVELPTVSKITIGWAKRFHAWLQTQKGGSRCPRPVSGGQASRFVLKLSNVLDWLIEDDLISSNPVGRVSWPKLPDKAVQYLLPAQVNQLLNLPWEGTQGVALWWFLLMCCTGLDYPDAIAYARNRQAYEVMGPEGMKIVGKRNKPPHGEFCLPLLNEVNALFSMCPNGPIVVSNVCLNRYTKSIETVLGISWRITNKTARKTFGYLMLAAGHRIADVSLMLGHSRIVTTERYYVKVNSESIDRAMSRIRVDLTQLSATNGVYEGNAMVSQNLFQHIYKAS